MSQTGWCVCTTGAVSEGCGILGSKTSTGGEGMEHDAHLQFQSAPSASRSPPQCEALCHTPSWHRLSHTGSHAFSPTVDQQELLLLYVVYNMRYFVTQQWKKRVTCTSKPSRLRLSMQSTGSFRSPAPVTVSSWFTAKHRACLGHLFSLAWIYFVTSHW